MTAHNRSTDPHDDDVSASEWIGAPHVPASDDPEPLPLDALPPVLRAHVESVAAATQTPTDMAALIGLAAVSTALRGRVEVNVDPRGWREPVNIYAVVVMEPGARKSPVYKHMISPLETWEAEQGLQLAQAYHATRDRAEVAEAALKRTRDEAARGKATDEDVQKRRSDLEAAKAAVPVVPRLVASDATPEALVQLMADQGGAMALLGPEGDALGIADGRYSDAARFDELLRAWSAEAIVVDRKGRERLVIQRPALTIGICVQPALLENLQNAHVLRGRGLWARVLWAVPPSRVGFRLTGSDVPPLTVGAAMRYERMLRVLLGESGSDFRSIDLTEEARVRLYDYELEIEVAMQPGGRFAGIADSASKMHGQAVRVAALLELASRAEQRERICEARVGLWAMDSAVRIMRALSTHALSVLGDIGVDQREADSAYVLRRIRELPEGSTRRDLYRAVQGRKSIRSTDDLAEVLYELDMRNCIRQHSVSRAGAGRLPSPIIELHPDLKRTDSGLTVPVNAAVVI